MADGFLLPSPSSINQKPFSVSTLNPNVLKLEYAVRGPILTRALEISAELKEENSWPFTEIIFLNIGNPQNLGQKSITFCRQLLSVCCFPDLIDNIHAQKIFPSDVIDRARIFLSSISSFGGYSHSLGFEIVRKEVANFIELRDNCEVNEKNIFLSDGASKIISAIISCLAKNEVGLKSGILIPIPQYPLYSATLTYFGIEPIPYYLEENSEWSINIQDISLIIHKYKDKCIPRAIVVINPGNPTGQCLKFDEQILILKFCHSNRILLLADEVYQDNVYDSMCNWYSFRKVFSTIEEELPELQMISFHSISKGYMGECGFRGGYAELVGIDEDTRTEITKLLSSMLCPNIAGQLLLSTYVNPPNEHQPSYEQFIIEKKIILNSLKKRAHLVFHNLQGVEGILINNIQGSMYAFPQIILPKKFVEAASRNELKYLQVPDVFYCMRLLEETGIVTVPGSGFGQKDGTWHFRVTILPPEEKLSSCLITFRKFHDNLFKFYS